MNKNIFFLWRQCGKIIDIPLYRLDVSIKDSNKTLP